MMIDFLSGKKAALFDLDGLLIDSEPAWDEADALFLKKHDVTGIEKLRKEVLGMGVKEGIELFKKEGLKGDTEELMQERRATFLEVFLKKPRLLPGAREIIDAVKQSEFKMAIATGGHVADTVRQILKKLDLSGFEVILSSDEVKHGKPAPDVFLEAAKRLGVTPEEAVVFEDSPNGAKAGKNAGMFVIGVNIDSKLQMALDKAGADIIAPELTAVLPLFKQGCCQGDGQCACA